MSCDLFSKQLEHYARGELSPAMEQSLETHLAECSACTGRLNAERKLLGALRSQSVPVPSVDFESRILTAATRGAAARRSWQHPMAGSAVAAVLALGVFIGLQWQSDQPEQTLVADSAGAGETTVVEASAALPEFEPREQTVKLAFHSGRALDDVTLTLELPANVELASYPGRQRLSWQVSLKEGDNVLALPLKVLFPGDGALVAHLDDGTRQKTFRAPIHDKTEPAS
ncbi:anti-sigma factor family protein [Marinobacter sp. SS21]|uniref:anti-sigma factor family protein n=1 Tax=Marinobacter sp. SS21 TaxID=2979460 RepID=UPI00232B7271|nr:zf-HC2 domain-containing protein [Marinobacter sp. SS21]MDC0661282.1 zf-HC2 domain-containing protein [Marinobacter sp. SS21]